MLLPEHKSMNLILAFNFVAGFVIGSFTYSLSENIYARLIEDKVNEERANVIRWFTVMAFLLMVINAYVLGFTAFNV